jgi:hypothetical protein
MLRHNTPSVLREEKGHLKTKPRTLLPPERQERSEIEPFRRPVISDRFGTWIVGAKAGAGGKKRKSRFVLRLVPAAGIA